MERRQGEQLREYRKGYRFKYNPDKTYTVNVSLTDAQLIGDKPIKKVLVDNAPAIEDLYKDCKWKFDDAHVEYNGNEVTITPDQPAKTYTVKFFKNNGEQNEFETITQVKLNSLVKKDGKFITAEKLWAAAILLTG